MKSLTQKLSPRLGIETLEERAVPAATVLDLTTAGTSGVINDAVFQQCDAQPTGTGVIRAFVRVSPGGNVANEQGYNTDARPLQFDENKSPQFTRSQRLDGVPVVQHEGVAYRQFLLDVNQKASAPNLSLDELRLYLGDSGSLSGYDSVTKQLAGRSAVYDMDAGGDSWVKLNYRLNSGSGSGDMFFLVKDSLFAGADPNSHIYLYSKFGGQAGFAANAGFEEWAVRSTGQTTPPPPAPSASLSGYVYVDKNDNGVRGDVAGEEGIGGVIMHLRGTDDVGRTVDLVTTTDGVGFYQFTNLRAGEYSIWEEEPVGGIYFDGKDSAGSLGGTAGKDEFGNDLIAAIMLAAGQNGVEYNFGELLAGS